MTPSILHKFILPTLCSVALFAGCSDDSSSNGTSSEGAENFQEIVYDASSRIYALDSGVTHVKFTGAEGKKIFFTRGNVAKGDEYDPSEGRIAKKDLSYVVGDAEEFLGLKKQGSLQKKDRRHSDRASLKHPFAAKSSPNSLRKEAASPHEYTIPTEPQKQLTAEDIIPGKTTRVFKITNTRYYGETGAKIAHPDTNYRDDPWLEVEFTARSVGKNVIIWSISSDNDPKTGKPWTFTNADGDKFISETNSKIKSEGYDIIRKKFEAILASETEMFGGVAKKILTKIDVENEILSDPVDAARYNNLTNFTNILIYDFAAVSAEEEALGYISPIDFLPSYEHYGYSSPEDIGAASNEGSFLYIFDRTIYSDPMYVFESEIDPETGMSYQFYLTMAHEFMHSIHFSRQQIEKGVNTENTAFQEMLAQICEHLMGPQIGVPNNQGVVAYRFQDFALGYDNVGMLEYAPDRDSYPMGVAVGVFLLQNYGGQKLFSEMLTNAYDGWDAIIKAIEKVTGEKVTKKDLMEHFMEAYGAKGSIYAENMNQKLEVSFNGKKSFIDGINTFNFFEHGYYNADDGDADLLFSSLPPTGSAAKEDIGSPLRPEGGIHLNLLSPSADKNLEFDIGNDGTPSKHEHLYLLVSDAD